MKIRIEFTDKEKWELARATECPITKDEKGFVTIVGDESKKIEGRFGTSEYNSEEKYIELNLSEAFIVSIATLISGSIGLIKSFISMLETFYQGWFSDSKEVEDEESNHEKEKPICPVRRATEEEKEALGKSPLDREGVDDLINDINNNKEEE